MIVTIVAITTIVQKFDWTMATILTIHKQHDRRDRCDHHSFTAQCIKPDDGYSVFTSVVNDSISLNSESIRSPFKIACYLSVLYENRKPRKFANSVCPWT